MSMRRAVGMGLAVLAMASSACGAAGEVSGGEGGSSVPTVATKITGVTAAASVVETSPSTTVTELASDTTVASVATTTMAPPSSTTTVVTPVPVTTTTTAETKVVLVALAPVDPDRLGERLAELGYRSSDAVLTAQKEYGLERDGVAGSATLAALAGPPPRRPVPSAGPQPRIEIDLERQVLYVVANGAVAVLPTSTGNNETYVDPKSGTKETANTPTGDYAVYASYDESVEAPLGTLYRPMYFLSGWAVHGSGFVPPWPDSHGCARLSYADMDWLWGQLGGAIGVPVTVR